MSEIKWIKITTDMFEDEKIDFISSLPEADAIIVIWIRILALAGKCNAGGYVLLTEKIPYTEEMLAHKFKKPINVIRLALETFRRLDMIDYDNQIIFLPNWEKHQNIDEMLKIRELTKVRVQRHREKVKALKPPENDGCNVTVTVDVTHGNATDIDKELDIDKEKEKEIYIPFQDIINYLNAKSASSYKHTTRKTQDCIRARWNEGFRADDFKTVIDKKTAEWLNTDMEKYLRPETLFGTKFEGYLNQKGGTSSAKPHSRDAPDDPEPDLDQLFVRR